VHGRDRLVGAAQLGERRPEEAPTDEATEIAERSVGSA
jgi:hypothetical protein